MHFIHRARQHGIAGDAGLNMEGLIHLLESKIRQLNIENAKQDIIRFIPDPESLNIWSIDYFIQLTEKIKFLDGH